MDSGKKLVSEELFDELYFGRSNTHNFEKLANSSLIDDNMNDWIKDWNSLEFQSDDDIESPYSKNIDFHDEVLNENIQNEKILQEAVFGIQNNCKPEFEHISDHSNNDVYIMEFGVKNTEYDKKKIKEEDNHTIVDESPEEEKGSDESYGEPKKQRKDVSYKTILRKCRKYYQQRFNQHTGFLRNKKKEPCSFYRDCVLKFIEEWVPIKTNLNISFHMGALLYPQEMIKRIESFVYPNGIKNFTPKKVVKRKLDTHRQQVEKLHSILYKFTHEKLEKFVSVPELAAIFLNYIEQMNEMADEDENSVKHMKDLTKRCRKSIGKSRKTRSVVTLFD